MIIKTPTTSSKYLNLPIVEDDLFTAKPYNLSKANCVRLIERLHQAVLTANALPDQDRDYRGLVDEMIREQWTPAAIARGFKRGSRKFGALPCHRSPRGKSFAISFNEGDVIAWFETNIEPVLMLAITHAIH
ncbi:hypothetical protein [Methylobacter psychrophilus]|uniref:hypothetical protein n=1 Tax=Methylobacter psychrophilus TaxID=96941 RepID=UPI0021D4C5D3|nr:hypothetical protein [Methylobacter psychrophilus]